MARGANYLPLSGRKAVPGHDYEPVTFFNICSVFHNSSGRAAIEVRARRAAKRIGLIAHKSRWRRDSADNRGGFMITEPERNLILAGYRFDFPAEEVSAICNEREGFKRC